MASQFGYRGHAPLLTRGGTPLGLTHQMFIGYSWRGDPKNDRGRVPAIKDDLARSLLWFAAGLAAGALYWLFVVSSCGCCLPSAFLAW